jgi:hypothetical protein
MTWLSLKPLVGPKKRSTTRSPCAVFKYYNTWIVSSGVAGMPPEAYDVSGRRLAGEGYVPVPRKE